MSQVGTEDNPTNTYCNPYTAHFGRGTSSGCTVNGWRAEEWCADFAEQAWQQAGVDITGLTAATSSYYNYTEAHPGSWHPLSSGYTPQPGDVAIYGPLASSAHVGVVISGTNQSPNVVNGDYETNYPNDLPTGVVYQTNDTNNGAGANLSGYVSPAGGGGGNGSQNRPSAISRGTGSMDVFFRTSDGHLAEDFWGSNTGWVEQVLPGPSNVASSPSAISRTSGSMDVFYRTTDGHLAEDYWGSNTGWANQTLPGWNNVAGDPSAINRDSNSMDVFYRTTGGNLSEDYWSVAGGWNSTGLTGPANVASDPSAISRYSGSMDVFYGTTDGHLAEDYWGSNTGWNNQTLPGWNNVANDPSAINRDSNSMDVFYRTTGGNLSEDYWSVAGGWNSTGLTGPANVAGDPSAISRYSGSMDVFYRTTDGHLAENYWGSNTGWNNQTLPGSNDVAGDPSALHRDSGSMDAFYEGASGGLGGIGEDYWSVAGGWVNQALTVSPSFTLTIAKAGTGSGTVSSNPAGIDCGSNCSDSFANGSQVTLTATPSPGSEFAGWSGAGCTGTGSCVVNLNQISTATATFNALCIAPNVTGMKLTTATAVIKNANCSVGKLARAFSKSVGRGKVITQKPPAGTQLAGGSAIRLTVSKGRRPRKN